MGLDIDAINAETGEIVAELRIPVWDYCTNALWNYAAGYSRYGGVLDTEELKDCLRRAKNPKVDYTEEKEKSQEMLNITAHTVKHVTGKKVGSELPTAKVEDPDRLIEKHSQLVGFFKRALEENTHINIKVV